MALNKPISRRGSTSSGSKIWPWEALQNPSNSLKVGVTWLTLQGYRGVRETTKCARDASARRWCPEPPIKSDSFVTGSCSIRACPASEFSFFSLLCCQQQHLWENRCQRRATSVANTQQTL